MRYRTNLLGSTMFCLISALAVAWGWVDAGGMRGDMPGHATAVILGAMGLLLGLPIAGSHAAVKRRVRAVRAAPEYRWTVTPEQIAALLAWQRKAGIVNAWRPTRSERRDGLEVCWDGEHLVIGAHYLRVGPGQMFPFTGVRVQVAMPANVSLHYLQPWAHNMSSVPRIVRTEREFRFPVPDEVHARAFFQHFERRIRGESSLARRRRLRRLSNWALGTSACCVLLLALGLGVAMHDRGKGIYRPTSERAALIGMVTFGVMGAPLLLILGVALRPGRP